MITFQLIMPSVENDSECMSPEHIKRGDCFIKKTIKIINSKGELDHLSNTENGRDELTIKPPFKLLPGEYVEYYGLSSYATAESSATSIFLTNYRISVKIEKNRILYNIPIRCIDLLECRDMFYVYISCKDGQVAKLSFDNSDCSSTWFRILTAVSSPPSKIESIFAFAFYAWSKDDEFSSFSTSRRKLFSDCKDRNLEKLVFGSSDSKLHKCRKSKNATYCDSNVALSKVLRTAKTSIYANGADGCEINGLVIRRRLRNEENILPEIPADDQCETFAFANDRDPDCKEACLAEFERLGFDPSLWRLTEMNHDYSFCPTYPKNFIVPTGVSDQDLESVARYRSLRRVPAVVWRHKLSGAVMVRCSQPETGIFGWRCAADESLLSAIINNTRKSTEKLGEINAADLDDNAKSVYQQSLSMLILDARSYAAAWANRAKGGGFESTEYYRDCEIHFLGLANIHAIRYSFQRLRSLCWGDESGLTSNWFQNLDATQWVAHLAALLQAALRVVECLCYERRNVLVHCSDGWDRTTQIVSLAKIILDPYYRTFKGFKELVDREWIAFGHKFGERSGLTLGDANQKAPVFLQWLDCVHHLYNTNCTSFEFNELFLIKLAQHTYSGLFGTFLCNSAKEYSANNIPSRTFSIWSYLNPSNAHFRNLLYVVDSCIEFDGLNLQVVKQNNFCVHNGNAININAVIDRSLVGVDEVDRLLVENDAESKLAKGNARLSQKYVIDRPLVGSSELDRLLVGNSAGSKLANGNARRSESDVIDRQLVGSDGVDRPLVGADEVDRLLIDDGVESNLANGKVDVTRARRRLVLDGCSAKRPFANCKSSSIDAGLLKNMCFRVRDLTDLWRSVYCPFSTNRRRPDAVNSACDWSSSVLTSSSFTSDVRSERTLMALSSMAIVNQAESVANGDGDLSTEIAVETETSLAKQRANSTLALFPLPHCLNGDLDEVDDCSVVQKTLTRLLCDVTTNLAVEEACLDSVMDTPPNAPARSDSLSDYSGRTLSNEPRRFARRSSVTYSNSPSSLSSAANDNSDGGGDDEPDDGYVSRANTVILPPHVGHVTDTPGQHADHVTDASDADAIISNGAQIMETMIGGLNPADETSSSRVEGRITNQNNNGVIEETNVENGDASRETPEGTGFFDRGENDGEEEDVEKRVKWEKKRRINQNRLDVDGLIRTPNEIQNRIRHIVDDYEERIEAMQREIDSLKRCLFQQAANTVRIRNESLRSRRYTSGESSSDAVLESLPLSASKANNFSDTSWEAVDESDLVNSPPRAPVFPAALLTPLKNKPLTLQKPPALNCRAQSGIVSASGTVAWAPDHSALRCTRCGVEFWAVVRRHHCRSCGLLFCNACTNYESFVPSEQCQEPVRVCHNCYLHLNQCRQQKITV